MSLKKRLSQFLPLDAPVSSNGASAAPAAPAAPAPPVATKQGSKVAPNPASLPTPFLDIWNSLIQQHQQSPNGSAHPENSQTAPSSKSVSSSKEERKSKPKASSVPSAPRLPSLQVIYSIL